MKDKKRKPKPEPPRWMYLEDLDDCYWGCKNKNGCNSCSQIKRGLRMRKIKSRRDLKQLIYKEDE